MGFLKKMIVRAMARIGSMSRPRRLAAALLGLAMMAGGLWLATSPAADRMVALTPSPLGPAEIAAASVVLDSQGIESKASEGKLLVHQSDLSRARAVMAYEGVAPRDEAATFEQLAKEDDMWRTSEQNSKRWLAAKMSTLSRLIALLPGVRSATVILEPGTPQGLGKAAQPPTAAVKISLRDGQKMSPRLVEAVADLVSGSVAGMTRQDVRIVDSTGKSHRISESGQMSAEDRLETLRAEEAYYAQAVRGALAYVLSPIVTVRVAQEKDQTRCRSVSVSVPRSYLVAAAAGGRMLSDAQLSLAAQPQLSRIREAVMQVAAIDKADDVKVDWYYDVPTPAISRAEAAEGWLSDSTTLVAGLILGSCVLVIMANYVWRRRSERVARRDLQLAVDQYAASLDAAPVLPAGLGVLDHMDPDDLADLVRSEHPQTAAVILAHVSAARAGEVLSLLDGADQPDIARRVANLDQMDRAVLREVERGLMTRLAQSPTVQRVSLGGAMAAAKMLRHAGYAAEQTVLETLQQDEPALAGAIEKNLLSFDDVVAMPAHELRAALQAANADELAIALCVSPEEAQRKVLSCLAKPVQARVREHMKDLGPLRLSDVEAAQQGIVEILRQHRAGRYVPAAKVESEIVA